ncbi:MAG: acyltransferase family protein [Pseudomonadota bacterium]
MQAQAHPTRLYFLDWVRIIAFFVLIVYHIGMYYVGWDWHVKSPAKSDAIEPLMLLSSPWRLGLLFLISGVASRFMLVKLDAGRFMRERSLRLLVPLLFGMLVIVPPQSYFEVVEKLAYTGSYADFMRLYLSAYSGFCSEPTECLILPTWNHLWFVAYLWAYTLLLGALMWSLGARFDKLSDGLARRLVGWRIFVLPLAVLGAVRVLMHPHFPTTHALIDDWYNNANYFLLFLLGAMLARQAAFWARVDALRWTGLATALSCWAAMTIYYSLPEPMRAYDGLEGAVQRLVYALCQWSAIIAVCGFAHRHLTSDSAARRYLTQAAFPVYIAHQTLIVGIAHLIKPAELAPVIEAFVLLVLTLSISFALFEVARRSRLLRPLFGLSEKALPAARAPALPAPAAPGAVALT